MDPQNNEIFVDGSTFNQLISLYEFDRRLRQLFMAFLERIEIAFRTHITYHLSHSYGSLGYTNKEVFINEDLHEGFLLELEKALLKGKNSESFVKHYYENYNGEFPIWVAIEVASFGTISKLYKNLIPEIKQVIGKNYYNIPYSYIESWLQTLSNVRNVCAHYGRLYNKNLTFKPRLFKEERKNINNNKLFAAIYIAIRLLTKVEGNRFITDLEALILEYENHVDFTYIGLPFEWKELLLIINSRKQSKNSSFNLK